jgi:hypothetical protein
MPPEAKPPRGRQRAAWLPALLLAALAGAAVRGASASTTDADAPQTHVFGATTAAHGAPPAGAFAPAARATQRAMRRRRLARRRPSAAIFAARPCGCARGVRPRRAAAHAHLTSRRRASVTSCPRRTAQASCATARGR